MFILFPSSTFDFAFTTIAPLAARLSYSQYTVVFSILPVARHDTFISAVFLFANASFPGLFATTNLVCFITAAGQKRDANDVFSDGGKGKQRRIDQALGKC